MPYQRVKSNGSTQRQPWFGPLDAVTISTQSATDLSATEAKSATPNAATAAADEARLVLAEQITAAFRIVQQGLPAGLGAALLLLFVLYGFSPPGKALVWFAVFLACIFGTWVHTRRSQAAHLRNAPLETSARRLVMAALLNGVVWGTAGLVLFEDDLAGQLALVFALSMVAFGGVTTGSSYRPLMATFTIPLLLPVLIRIVYVADRFHLILALGVLLFLAFLLFYARLANKVVTESIKTRFENTRLNEALTEQRVRERTAVLEAASQHKSEFLSSMSHELRTPLNAIIGFSEVLKERMFGELNEKQAEYMEDIHASGHHLLSLINDILDLSKVEAGRMELALSKFDVPAAIENAVTLVKERALRHSLALEVKLDERLNSFVGDERKFKQILLNLLSNAVKFTPEGGRIAVTAEPTEGGVQVSVSDTGIGIAPEQHEAIFEAFHQVGSEYTTKREGTGLGLSLVKQFVELHGGRVWVTSAPAKGSTFYFTLAQQPWQTQLS